MSNGGTASLRHFEPWFSVSTHVLDGAAFVSVTGELDLATGPVLIDSMHNHDGQHERVIFDLSGLHFIDVAGFRALLGCVDCDTAVSIRNPSDAARRLLHLIGQVDLIEEEVRSEGLVPSEG